MALLALSIHEYHIFLYKQLSMLSKHTIQSPILTKVNVVTYHSESSIAFFYK